MPVKGSRLGKKHILCRECNHVSRSHVLHVEHFKLQHPTLKPYTCTASGCNKTFKNRSHLKGHMITHESTRGAFKCPQCPREFLNQSSVVSHERDFHPLQKQAFNCLFPGCAFVTTLARYLAAHEKTHSSNREEFRCNRPGCDSTFFYNKSLKDHLKKHHVDGFPCHFCTELGFPCHFCTELQFTCNFCTELGFTCNFCTELQFTCNFCTELGFTCNLCTVYL